MLRPVCAERTNVPAKEDSSRGQSPDVKFMFWKFAFGCFVLFAIIFSSAPRKEGIGRGVLAGLQTANVTSDTHLELLQTRGTRRSRVVSSRGHLRRPGKMKEVLLRSREASSCLSHWGAERTQVSKLGLL